jgi:hypothetical protein
MNCVQIDQCRPFRVHNCQNCHADSNYTHWLEAKSPYTLNDADLQLSYQPYVVVRTSCVPPFPTEFDEGVGNDMLAWIHHLRHFGAIFTVLPQPAFVLHRNHHPNAWEPIKDSDEEKRRQGRAQILFGQFVTKLKKQPGARLGCYGNRAPKH